MIGQRHYGMDWLRIGAFALLILYHTGMVFVPWDFHIKSVPTFAWVETPMLALNPWRLCLLFLVSGFASRNLLAKQAALGPFLRARAARLGLPLLFGIILIVPPQSWVEQMAKHGYDGSFLHFWTRDYFRFGTMEGVILPTWNHLWFVVYLLVYTMLLGIVLASLPRTARASAQRGFDRIMGGWGVILLPILLFLVQRAILHPLFGETHALFDDWAAHPLYLGCFLFGLALAGSPAAWDAIRAHWHAAAMCALVSGAAFLWFAHLPGSGRGASALLPGTIARSVFAWTMIVALIGVADRFWNRDRPVRKMLTEAVFPFYLIHQTIIVLVAWWMVANGIGALPGFILIAVSTALGCWLFYDLGRRIDWLRPWIGLQRLPPVPAASLASQTE